MIDVAEVGNTSAASIPIALDRAYRAGRMHEGDLVVFTSFGAGLTWGATAMRWTMPGVSDMTSKVAVVTGGLARHRPRVRRGARRGGLDRGDRLSDSNEHDAKESLEALRRRARRGWRSCSTSPTRPASPRPSAG